MKAKAVVLAAAAVSAAVVFGQGLVPAGKPRVPAKEKPAKELTPEEVEQNRAKAAAFRKAIADRGGWVSVPMAGPALQLVDATAKGWALEGLEAVKANLDRYGLCPVEAVRKGVPANALAEGLEAAKGTCGVVMLVDGAEDAPLMAVYPEERLALIDMTALSKGVKGSGVRQDRVEKLTGAAVNKTSPDGLFSLDATRCLGACGLAPVCIIDGKYYGNALVDSEFTNEIRRIVREEKKAGAKA